MWLISANDPVTNFVQGGLRASFLFKLIPIVAKPAVLANFASPANLC
jgi:hypothetical protein